MSKAPLFKVVFLMFGAAGMGCPSLKDTFVQQTYPKQFRPAPEIERVYPITAMILPLVTQQFDAPRKAGKCFEALADRKDFVRELEDFSTCLVGRATQEDRQDLVPSSLWRRCINQDGPYLTCAADQGCTTSLDEVCKELGPEDRFRIVAALSEIAEDVGWLQGAFLGGQEPTALPAAETREGVRGGARILQVDPTEASNRHRYPGLALSGGGANGAFTAGYLYALLSAREHAIKVGGLRPTSERFGYVVGTSVGSLLALLLDLYFVEAGPGTLPESTKRYLRGRCEQKGALGSRVVQECALWLMHHYFTEVTEDELLCVEDGSILSLLTGAKLNLARFEPMKRLVIDPMVEAFDDHLLSNDFIRVATTVETQRNLFVGLDERVCLLVGDADKHDCLANGVLASVVQPILARPVSAVYFGVPFEDDRVQALAGYWLDGGLRSTFPVALAVEMQRPRRSALAPAGLGQILAIDAGRVEGVPSHRPTDSLGLIMDSIGELTHQIARSELAFAQAHELHRRARTCYLATQTDDPAKCVTEERAAALGPSASSTVWSVYVPDSIQPRILAASGYTFDPEAMTGLFLWGEKVFLEQRRRVLEILGFGRTLSLAEDMMNARLKEVNSRIDELRRRYSAAHPRAWQDHLDDRRKALDAKILTCDEFYRKSSK